MLFLPNIQKVCVMAGAAVLLSGCSWLGDWPPSGSKKEALRAPPPETKVMRSAEATWIEPDADQKAVPVKAKDDPSYKNAIERINKLEESVASIRNDMSMMMPALTKLAEAQGDIQQLLRHMDGDLSSVQPAAGASDGPRTLTPASSASPASAETRNYTGAASGNRQEQRQEQHQAQARNQGQASQQNQPVAKNAQEALAQMSGASQAPRQVASVNQQAQGQGNTQSPQRSGGGSAVTQMRFGEHPDKTRIVFDTGQQVSFDYDLDNSENILLVKFPRAGWNAAQKATVGNSDLVQSYSAMPNAQGGTDVILQLKRQARVQWAQSIPPSGGGQGHRVVLDVAPM